MESTELARLRRVAGRQTTRLTHYGRKTGKSHEVTIWFVLDGDKLYIGTANVNRHWVKNVQKTPRVELTIGGETFRGTAQFLSNRTEHERAMTAIRPKVLDVSTNHGTRSNSLSYRAHARQHWII
jgi:deazaflavin-dependent oxidoreductase (nitroreductase family)